MDYIKYPRTEHLKYSKEIEIEHLPQRAEIILSINNTVKDIINNTESVIVIEEKMDGMGLGVGFEGDTLFVQHRGSAYSIGMLPKDLYEFGQWLQSREEELFCALGQNYVLFGEWLYYKHTIYYNNLPDYFLEYDIFDKAQGVFLSTSKRRDLMKQMPSLFSVKVVKRTNVLDTNILKSIGLEYSKSLFKTEDSIAALKDKVKYSLIRDEIINNTLLDNRYEGFYVKVETPEHVVSRHKWIRKDFMNMLLQGEHWKKSARVTNDLNKKIKA